MFLPPVVVPARQRAADFLARVIGSAAISFSDWKHWNDSNNRSLRDGDYRQQISMTPLRLAIETEHVVYMGES